MPSAKRTTLTSVAALAALSWTCHVFAGESSSVFGSSPAVAAIPATAFPSLERLEATTPSASATPRRNPFGTRPLAQEQLAGRRGGDRVFNDAQLKGVVSDNQAINTVTGSNVISEGAFSGAAGVSTVIQNSGNNVLIQNATIVNVQLK